MRILLVEDNRILAATIQEYFLCEGNPIDWAESAEVVERSYCIEHFDLLILDINLPGRNGYQLLKSLRGKKHKIPVLILTARTAVDDRVGALDLGADDYLVKPFDLRELAARGRALVRRKYGEANDNLSYGDLVFNRATKLATVNGSVLDLGLREAQLLELFLANLDRILSKEQISNRIYRYDQAFTPNAIEQALTRLRRKLEGTSVVIKTVRGLGYLAHVND